MQQLDCLPSALAGATSVAGAAAVAGAASVAGAAGAAGAAVAPGCKQLTVPQGILKLFQIHPASDTI